METRTVKEPVLSQESRAVLARVLEVHGFHELASGQLFASGVRLAPTLDEKQLLADQARDELHHFELIAILYEVVAGGDLVEAVGERAGQVTPPVDWVEMAVVAFLSDRVGNAVLRAGVGSNYAPYSQVVRRIVEGEREHQRVTAAILHEVCEREPGARERAQAYLVQRLSDDLTQLSEESAGLFSQAKVLGLLPQDAAEIRRALLDEIRSQVEPSGIHIPADL